MLRFISFGSGSSGNCYMLYTDHDALLIDVGVGLRGLKKNMREFGLNLSCVSHILVTHDHADHIRSVGSISSDCLLPVVTTKTVHEGIDRNYCVVRKIAQELRIYIEPNTSYSLGEFRVTPFTVPHDSSDCVGYFIEAEGATFCLVTDAGTVTDSIAPYIERANYLVIEANHDVEMLRHGPYPLHLQQRILSDTGHLSNTACGEAIVRFASPALRHVWLCHLSEENNHPELARKTVESILRSYGLAPGTDFKLDVLNRTKPTGIFELQSPSSESTPF